MESVPNDLTAGPSPDASGAAGGEFKAGKAELLPRATTDVPSYRHRARRARLLWFLRLPCPPNAVCRLALPGVESLVVL